MTPINKQANTIVSDEEGASLSVSLYNNTESIISLNSDSNQTDVLATESGVASSLTYIWLISL